MYIYFINYGYINKCNLVTYKEKNTSEGYFFKLKIRMVLKSNINAKIQKFYKFHRKIKILTNSTQ